MFQTLKEECTKTVCDCELVYVVGNGGKHIYKQLMAFASVNCSHRGLTEMPSFLPANTTTLHLSGNKVAIYIYIYVTINWDFFQDFVFSFSLSHLFEMILEKRNRIGIVWIADKGFEATYNESCVQGSDRPVFGW